VCGLSIAYVTNNIGRVYYPDARYFAPAVCAGLGLGNTSTCGVYYLRILEQGVPESEAAYYVPSAMPSNVNAAIKAVALVGTFCGQLLFGYLGDRLGRKPVYGITLILMIVCSVGSGLSFGSSPAGVVASLCLFRFFLGVGVGGDYPLSAVIMSEYASKAVCVRGQGLHTGRC
jgi:MFS family permease